MIKCIEGPFWHFFIDTSDINLTWDCGADGKTEISNVQCVQTKYLNLKEILLEITKIWCKML